MGKKKYKFEEGTWVRGTFEIKNYTKGDRTYLFIGYVVTSGADGCMQVCLTCVKDTKNCEYCPERVGTKRYVFEEDCEEIEEVCLDTKFIKMMIDFALDIKDEALFKKYAKQLKGKPEITNSLLKEISKG